MSIPQNKKDSNNKKNIFESNQKYFTICVYALFVIAISAVIVYSIANWTQTQRTFSNILQVLSPFLIGFFLAFLLNPIVNFLNDLFSNKRFKKLSINDSLRKGISIAISYVIFISVIVIILIYVVPQFASSIEDLTGNMNEMYNQAYKFLNNIQDKYPEINLSFIQDKITEMRPELINFGTNFVTNAFPVIFNISVSIVKSVINILLAIVISAYFLFDKELLLRNLKRLVYAILRKDRADYLCATASECNAIFSGFIIGKFIDSLIIGVICFIVMCILRLPYAMLLSTIVGITNMIPYFGPFVGAVPGVVIYLLIDPIQAIIFGIMILALQQFDGLYLGPKILGESTGLKPIWVIFAITVGGAYFGVIGMFLGVPVVAVLAFLIEQFIQRKLKAKNINDI